jgi:uncharacterized integral membrane protein
VADAKPAKRDVSPKLIVAVILATIGVILVIVNSQKVEVDVLFHTFKWPLFIVIIGAALVGWLVGWSMGKSRAGD